MTEMVNENESTMLYGTDISGNPELRTSSGTVGIDVGDDEVEILVPDRFGYSTFYHFTRADWDKVLEMFNAATEHAIRRDKWQLANATVHQLLDDSRANAIWENR